MEKEIRNKLIDTAIAQLQYSYTPYSNFKVGAALLAKMVRPTPAATLKTQATPPPTARGANRLFKAVSEGVKEFQAICVVGGKEGVLTEYAAPAEYADR